MTKQALLIVDHGSRLKKANFMLFDLVKNMRKKRPELIVLGAHMELALPSIEDAIKRAVKLGASHITVHPYMLSPGRHATSDIPNLANAVIAQYPNVTLTVTDPLGLHPLLLDVILDRAGH